MKTNKQLLAIAKKQIGNGGAKYRNYVHAGGSWCDMFVFWLYDANGCGSLLPWKGQQRTYCPTSIKWCQKNLAQIPLYLAMACDLIYFDWEKNGVPNHIGIALHKISTSAIATIEGNTSGGKVAEKSGKHARNAKYVQAVFRPHFAPTGLKKEKLAVDGDFGYKSIYNLQVALGLKPDGILGKATVKAWQKKVGASADGAWGRKTSLKAQKFLKVKADGAFGKNSVKALQKWINGKNFPTEKKTTTVKKPTTTSSSSASKPVAKPVAKTTNQQKLLAKAKELAWAYNTPKDKYSYKKGSPKAKCKTAMKKYGWASNKAEMSDCGNFVSTIVRESGVNKSFKALHGLKDPFPKSEKGFNVVHKGKAIPSGFLKAGDIVRYKKTNGHQHALMYYGSGKVCEASHRNRFGAIVKDAKRYNTQSKKATIQVLRPK